MAGCLSICLWMYARSRGWAQCTHQGLGSRVDLKGNAGQCVHCVLPRLAGGALVAGGGRGQIAVHVGRQLRQVLLAVFQRLDVVNAEHFAIDGGKLTRLKMKKGELYGKQNTCYILGGKRAKSEEKNDIKTPRRQAWKVRGKWRKSWPNAMSSA